MQLAGVIAAHVGYTWGGLELSCLGIDSLVASAAEDKHLTYSLHGYAVAGLVQKTHVPCLMAA